MQNESDNSWLGWAAGIIDGEAGISITCRRGGRNFILNLAVNTTDRAVAEKLAELLGGKVVPRGKHHGDKENHRPVWRWWLCSQNAVNALRKLGPWLIAKRPHFLVIQGLWEACHGKSKWDYTDIKGEQRVMLAKEISGLAVKGKRSHSEISRVM